MNSQFVTNLSQPISRRSAIKSALALGGAAAVPGLSAAASGHAPTIMGKLEGKLDYDDPRDNLYAFGKIWSSYDEPCIGAFHGLMCRN